VVPDVGRGAEDAVQPARTTLKSEGACQLPSGHELREGSGVHARHLLDEVERRLRDQRPR